MTERYWVYINEPNDKALVHRAGCAFCDDGHGMAVMKLASNGRWSGPFMDAPSAEHEARRSGKKTVRWCGHCARKAGVSTAIAGRNL